ncbi:MAG: acetylornithine transaminase [Cellulomonadaceae bacterium]|jgi:acetylornithine aminotransferase|nr:acetylornithine transaminase [Cellulomonadaceae bacterium]
MLLFGRRNKVTGRSGLPGVSGDARSKQDQWTDKYTQVVMDTFGPPQRVLVRGRGCYVWDANGKKYLDLLGGIAVNALGHADADLHSAMSVQWMTLGHISNFFASQPQINLAEKLLELAKAPAGSRVFFTNSGTEANEAAFKMARRINPHGLAASPATQDSGHRTRVLALENSFHGRSMGALALTHKAAYRDPFEPLPGGVEFVPVASTDDPLAALTEAFSSQAVAARGPVAALFVEPIQGEAGVRPLPPGYLALARHLTTQAGALLVLDEVQTGVGRTGAWFAHQLDHLGQGIQPDAMTLAKGLGGGFPIGAVIAFGPQAACLLGRGQHGTTFGGNPVAAASGLAVLAAIDRRQLMKNAVTVGHYLRTSIEKAANPLIDSVRGEGLLLAVQLTQPVAASVVDQALASGFIVNAVAPDAVRLAPPLIVTKRQAKKAAAFFATLTLPAPTQEPTP